MTIHKNIWLKGFLIAFIAVFLLGACQRDEVEEVSKETAVKEGPVPAWIAGGGIIAEAPEKVFYSSGYARGIKNRSLLRSTADNRARSSLSDAIQRYMDAMLENYGGEVGGADLERIKIISGKGIEIVDHWENPATGKLYARAQLDLELFKQNIREDGDLPTRIRDHLLQNADVYYTKLIGRNE